MTTKAPMDIIDSTALVVSAHAAPATLFGSDDPAYIVERASALATALKGVIVARGLTSNITGREYVRIEGWTLLGSLIGVFAVPDWTRPIGDGDGWEARVSARTLAGQVVGAAEAECLRSENNWSDRDSFALRSMAQTRASAKALRLALGFIVEMAGYSATPAEEMITDTPLRRSGKVRAVTDTSAPHCPAHPRYPMRAGKSGGYYCSAKAAAGEAANDKGYCSYRSPDVAVAPPMFDATGRTADEAALQHELSSALVAAQVTPPELAGYLRQVGVDFEGAGMPTVARITAYAQERGLSFAELADDVAADNRPLE